MALGRKNLSIWDGDIVVDGASIEVRRESDAALVSVYSDRAGVTPLGNPYIAADGADAGFYAPAGEYKIVATRGAFTQTWRHESIVEDIANVGLLYASRSAVEAATVPAVVIAISTAGYFSAGDGGGALYKRIASEPSHGGKIQSDDGAWWELAESEPNLCMFGAVGDNSTDNATAIDNAFGYCLARYEDDLPVELKIPGGIFRKSTSITWSAVFPISGLGKTSSRIVYTGAGVGMLLVPPTAPGTVFTNTNDGYHWRDFSIEPLVAGSGTYGIEIRTTVGQFAYSALEHIRIGDFGTSSLYLNNTTDLADGIYTSSFVECDFLNGITAVNIGDNIHFVNPKIHGDTVSSFTMKSGARRLMIHGGSLTGSGGIDFQDCNGVDLVEPHIEIFSGTSYNGGLNGLVRFLDCTEVSVQSARIAKVGTGTQPAYAIAIEGTTSGVTIIDPELASGSSGHITAASTTSDVLVISPKVDEGYSSRVITLSGSRSREMGAGVVTAGDADLTIKPSDRVIVLGAALTADRTLMLPALANVEDDHEIEFIDAAGGLGTYSWIIARASTDTIHGATSVTLGTQLGRFTLRKASSAVWVYGRLPVIMGGTGAATAATARTNLSAAASGANTDITSVYLNNTGLKIKDTNASHGLTIAPGSNITSDRTLTVTTGDADRTLDISAGNVTISAAGAALADDADASAQRTTIGLVAGGAGDIWVEKAGDSMSGALSITVTTAGTSALTVTSTDAGATAGPLVQLTRFSASPAASDVLAAMQFIGYNSSASPLSMGGFQAAILDPNAGSEDGAFYFTAYVAGGNGVRMSVANGVTIGSPTGSFQGVGTLNAVGVYDDGVLTT